MNNRKKASYGMKKMRGGDYMEPNKELKFGAPMDKKPKVKNNRRRAQEGDSVGGRLKRAGQALVDLPGKVADRYNQGVDREKERTSNARKRAQAESNARRASSAQSNVKSKVDSKGNQMIGTDADIKKMESMKAKSKSSGSYSEAKKRDANLDSYIKARNAAEKGSNEYNEAQNKINRAYGKGPIRKVEPAKTASTGKSAATAMASQSKPQTATLQTNMTSTKAAPAAQPTNKKDSRQTGRAAMQDRRQSARSRKNVAKEANADESRRVRRQAGKMAKANVKGNEAKADRAAEKFTKIKGNERKREQIKSIRKAEMGGPRRKAVTGMAVQAAGAGLQGIGALTNAIAGKETKFGKIADAAGSTAVTAGGMMGGIPGAQGALNAAKGAIPPPGGGGDAGAGGVTAPAPAADATQQPDPNAQPQARYGRKKKGKKGMMKYRAGGAKPDYLDMDKDGNKTESMKSALKDRRAKSGAMRGEKKKPVRSAE